MILAVKWVKLMLFLINYYLHIYSIILTSKLKLKYFNLSSYIILVKIKILNIKKRFHEIIKGVEIELTVIIYWTYKFFSEYIIDGEP